MSFSNLDVVKIILQKFDFHAILCSIESNSELFGCFNFTFQHFINIFKICLLKELFNKNFSYSFFYYFCRYIFFKSKNKF